MRPSVDIATSADGIVARPDDGLDWLSAVMVDGDPLGTPLIQ